MAKRNKSQKNHSNNSTRSLKKTFTVEKRIRDQVEELKEWLVGKNSEFDLVDFLDYRGAILRRRQKAIINTASQACDRYCTREKSRSYYEDMWISLNLPYDAYAALELEYRLLHAAAIWVLDQIESPAAKEKLFSLLPEDISDAIENDALYDTWNTKYDQSLVFGVEYILKQRNPIKTNSGNLPMILVNDALARKSVDHKFPDRKIFDELLKLIPQDSIDRAVAYFRDCAQRWTDQFFRAIDPYFSHLRCFETEIKKNAELSEKYYTQAALATEMYRTSMFQGPSLPVLQPSSKPSVFDVAKLNNISPRSVFDANYYPNDSKDDHLFEGAMINFTRLDSIWTSSQALIKKNDEVYSFVRRFVAEYVRYGGNIKKRTSEELGLTLDPGTPIYIEDPYALCFAFLYLIEANDDLPWLYGVGHGLMSHVGLTLPWAHAKYDCFKDHIWPMNCDDIPDEPSSETPNNDHPSTKNNQPSDVAVSTEATDPSSDPGAESDPVSDPPAGEDDGSVSLPNWYERKYRIDEKDSARNLAQILYEETGCVLPQDLHLYDTKAKLLKDYGLSNQEAASMLILMTALGTARRQTDDLDHDFCYDPEFEEEDGEDVLPERVTENTNALKDEIRRLKAALHAADKETRDAKKQLSELKESSDLEHRELADLREYVFTRDQNAALASGEEVADEDKWPYSVVKNTLVFGGHETWLKGIRGILTGNIRFIGKSLAFDTDLIKYADVIWIQPNALSHPMYWRIVDNARALKKPVRYFSYASWVKCAEQVLDADG